MENKNSIRRYVGMAAKAKQNIEIQTELKTLDTLFQVNWIKHQ